MFSSDGRFVQNENYSILFGSVNDVSRLDSIQYNQILIVIPRP